MCVQCVRACLSSLDVKRGKSLACVRACVRARVCVFVVLCFVSKKEKKRSSSQTVLQPLDPRSAFWDSQFRRIESYWRKAIEPTNTHSHAHTHSPRRRSRLHRPRCEWRSRATFSFRSALAPSLSRFENVENFCIWREVRKKKEKKN